MGRAWRKILEDRNEDVGHHERQERREVRVAAPRAEPDAGDGERRDAVGENESDAPVVQLHTAALTIPAGVAGTRCSVCRNVTMAPTVSSRCGSSIVRVVSERAWR